MVTAATSHGFYNHRRSPPTALDAFLPFHLHLLLKERNEHPIAPVQGFRLLSQHLAFSLLFLFLPLWILFHCLFTLGSPFFFWLLLLLLLPPPAPPIASPRRLWFNSRCALLCCLRLLAPLLGWSLTVKSKPLSTAHHQLRVPDLILASSSMSEWLTLGILAGEEEDETSSVVVGSQQCTPKMIWENSFVRHSWKGSYRGDRTRRRGNNNPLLTWTELVLAVES